MIEDVLEALRLRGLAGTISHRIGGGIDFTINSRGERGGSFQLYINSVPRLEAQDVANMMQAIDLFRELVQERVEVENNG